MKQKYISLLLATTLLTACGGGATSEADRNAAEGITSDGEIGQKPTITGGGQSGVIESVLAKNENQDKLTLFKANFDEMLSLAAPSQTMLRPTMEEETKFFDLVPKLFESTLMLYDLASEIYTTETEKYKKFDAKGDFSTAGWDKLIALNKEVAVYDSLLYNPFVHVRQDLELSPENLSYMRDSLIVPLSEENVAENGLIQSFLTSIRWITNKNWFSPMDLDRKLLEIAGKNLPKVKDTQRKYQAFRNLTNGNESANTESLSNLKDVIIGAVDTKLNRLFFKDPETDLTGSQKGVELGNAISDALAKKGFVRVSFTNSKWVKAARLTQQSDFYEFRHLENMVLKIALHVLNLSNFYSDSLNTFLANEDFVIFGVTSEALKELIPSVKDTSAPVGREIKEDEIFQGPFFTTGDLFQITNISSYEGFQLTASEVMALKLQMYKAFVGALIPRPEFKGLFDFLKTQDGFKDDAEFMALFTPSPAQLSSGAIRDISAAALRQARMGDGSVDLAAFKMNGVSGQSIELGLPLFVQLKGDVSSAKSTEAATGSVAYRLGNTVIGVIQGYVNSGAGFGTDSRQLETSVVASHSFGSFFVEGQVGTVSATDVHNSDWSGVRSQITVGLDTEFVSPFVQVSHRQLDRDGEYGLNDTTAYVGLDMDIAKLAADTYSVDTRLLAKAGYGSKDWSAGSKDLGSTTGFSGSVEWSASLNLNSGVSFGTNLALDTVAGSSAAVNVSLDR